MRYSFIFIAFFIVVFSCKENQKKNSDENSDSVSGKVSNDDYFTLTVNAIVEKDDTFTLLYLEGDQKDVSEENSIKINVSGDTNAQTLIFRLEEDVLPTKLLLRYSNPEKSQRIQFFEAQLSYYGEEFLIKRNQFYQYFIPNEFIEYNIEEEIATSKEKDKKYKPCFYSRKILEERIDLIL